MNRYRQNGTAEKQRGAVYTPPRVAAALVRWAVRSPGDVVLDPACGEGVFLSAARVRLADLGNNSPTCIGVDVDPVTAAGAGAICSDFFEWAKEAPRVDVVVGNPPFVRSHLFSEQSRTLAFQEMTDIGLHPSRLMSTWAPFVAVSCKLLNDGGRLAFVVPEELLHVGYAKELRAFLLTKFWRVIVCLPKADIFPSVQQAVVLLLCDASQSGPRGLFTLGFRELETGTFDAVEPAPSGWNWSTKWTHLFLTPTERELVEEGFKQLSWMPLRNYGRVEVGVVTGSNDFFIVERQVAMQLGEQFFKPVITGARWLPGIRFSQADFDAIAAGHRPAYLLNTASPLEVLPASLQTYLAQGEMKGVNGQYKCLNREPWYAIPSIWPADALLLRQAGEVPRLVVLDPPCTSTDTIHRVTWHNPSHGRSFAVGFLNTWTLLACELGGRSYGGGVLELMPSEANRLPVPPPSTNLDPVFESVDTLVRSRNWLDAVKIVDAATVCPTIGVVDANKASDLLLKLVERRKAKKNGYR